MKKMKMVQFISIGGILTALAVMFQSSPVFLPAIGLALSPFSTIPVAVAAFLNRFLGIAVLFSSTLILFIVSPQESMILLFTTGLLGCIVGSGLNRKEFALSILASAVALTIGMCILTYLVAVPGFAEITGSCSLPLLLLLYFMFSFIYAGIWNAFLRKFVKMLIRINV